MSKDAVGWTKMHNEKPCDCSNDRITII